MSIQVLDRTDRPTPSPTPRATARVRPYYTTKKPLAWPVYSRGVPLRSPCAGRLTCLPYLLCAAHRSIGLLVGVVGTAHERAGFDVAETHLFALGFEGGKFFQRDVALDWQ